MMQAGHYGVQFGRLIFNYWLCSSLLYFLSCVFIAPFFVLLLSLRVEISAHVKQPLAGNILRGATLRRHP